MWTCPSCGQQFIRPNQSHSCNDNTVKDFLAGKPEHIVELFHYFIEEFRKIGDFRLHPAKARIGFAGKIRFGYVSRIGKDFIDVVLQFPEAYHENFCFYKVADIPGADLINHYIRLQNKADINEEVRYYLKRALERGNASIDTENS